MSNFEDLIVSYIMLIFFALLITSKAGIIIYEFLNSRTKNICKSYSKGGFYNG